MEFNLEYNDLMSIGISILCGSIIGFEREYHNKSAGFRTIILICLGSTIFTIVSQHGAGSDDRIAANIITGIGFIGAGVIFKDRLSVLGLTTAAVIWTAAGIGMTTGIGYHFLAICLSVITVIILSVFGFIEKLMDRLPHSKTLNLSFSGNEIQNLESIRLYLDRKKIKAVQHLLNKEEGRLMVTLKVTAKQKQFTELDQLLVENTEVVSFHYV